MSFTLEVPEDLVERLKAYRICENESPIDIIIRLVDSIDEEFTPEEENVIIQGLEEFENGIFTTEEEMAKKIGY